MGAQRGSGGRSHARKGKRAEYARALSDQEKPEIQRPIWTVWGEVQRYFRCRRTRWAFRAGANYPAFELMAIKGPQFFTDQGSLRTRSLILFIREIRGQILLSSCARPDRVETRPYLSCRGPAPTYSSTLSSAFFPSRRLLVRRPAPGGEVCRVGGKLRWNNVDIETVRGRFNSADLALRAACRHWEPGYGGPFIVRLTSKLQRIRRPCPGNSTTGDRNPDAGGFPVSRRRAWARLWRGPVQRTPPDR